MSCSTIVEYKPMWGEKEDMDKFFHDKGEPVNGMYLTSEFVGYNYPEQLRKDVIDKYPGICFVGIIDTDNGTTARHVYQVIFGKSLVSEDVPDGIMQIGKRYDERCNEWITFDKEMPWCVRGYEEIEYHNESSAGRVVF